MAILVSNFTGPSDGGRPCGLERWCGRRENGMVTADMATGDWARYWRAADPPLEAMHAHFERHVYHRHSHDSYSLGVTDVGAQSFTCRGAAHTSAAGMVMAFNPDDPHDGQATDGFGFTYRMTNRPRAGVDRARRLGRPAGRAAAVRRPGAQRPGAGRPAAPPARRRCSASATALRRDELLTAACCRVEARRLGRPRAGAARAAGRRPAGRRPRPRPDRRPLPARSDRRRLAAATGCSRFALHRAFIHVYGMPPSDYQRQLRSEARGLIAAGRRSARPPRGRVRRPEPPVALVLRYYGVTPGDYQHSTAPAVHGKLVNP